MSKNKCSGTISVSSHTRNGKKISAYQRSCSTHGGRSNSTNNLLKNNLLNKNNINSSNKITSYIKAAKINMDKENLRRHLNKWFSEKEQNKYGLIAVQIKRID